MKKNYVSKIIFALIVVAFVVVCAVLAPPTQAVGTLWSLLPPIVAIGLALITKEVYSSLFFGILTGGVLVAASQGTGFSGMFETVIKEGIIGSLISIDTEDGVITGVSTGNIGIFVFLIVLGIIVVMMNKAGGSRAYGEWAVKRIKNRRGASLATFGLGALIFVDDYFNCLTVGSVMRPVTDKHQISRAKLAYLIDATAAPICIIAPISSWAAAVSGTVEGVNGISLFIQTIPFNLYALLTILMVVYISMTDLDFGSMRVHEDNAKKGDLFTTGQSVYPEDAQPVTSRGKVMDLVLPVIILIVFCIVGMLYTGGLFDGVNVIDAFADCDASFGLAYGSIGALILIVIYYMLRRVLNFSECMSAIPDGFKQMVPAILILTFAWSLKTMTALLGADGYVADLVNSANALQILLPAILFVVALGLAFATGTSWGTFGILIPIVTGVFSADIAASVGGAIPTMVVLCISACLAGAVCGDHCSPISDTTIMASTGAQCDHVNHVSTQLPYALTVAAVSFVGYLFSGLIVNYLKLATVPAVILVLGVSIVLMIATLAVLSTLQKRKAAK